MLGQHILEQDARIILQEEILSKIVIQRFQSHEKSLSKKSNILDSFVGLTSLLGCIDDQNTSRTLSSGFSNFFPGISTERYSSAFVTISCNFSSPIAAQASGVILESSAKDGAFSDFLFRFLDFVIFSPFGKGKSKIIKTFIL
ncbi:MAG: hypothetical protein ACTTH6_03570 [Candidatus Altimarinota bacterium]